MNEIILPKGVKVGHSQTDKTGVSVILADGAVAGVSVKGGAPGTRETALLSPEKSVQAIQAIAFCGGSAYGLAAADGVMRFCRENGMGYSIGGLVVPIVPCAVIFDLNENEYNFPDSNAGYEACKGAKSSGLIWGKIGAGTGATVGKILGSKHSHRGGIGASTVCLGEAFVTAITVVNALGDVFDCDSGKIVAGVHDLCGNFLDTNHMILSGKLPMLSKGANTTLSCVLTNVKLNKLQAFRLAQISQNGLAKAIRPVHTDYDGDTVFALSKGEVEFDFTALSVMAVEAVSRSIVRGVTDNG